MQSDEHEKKRIYEAGGTVEMDRVCVSKNETRLK